jgi:hypothetical protein
MGSGELRSPEPIFSALFRLRKLDKSEIRIDILDFNYNLKEARDRGVKKQAACKPPA